MIEQTWLPQAVDAHVPTDARVHNYALGGKDNFAVDRRYAHKVAEAFPAIGHPARENAKFARRAIRHLRTTGVRQFLEIGCGLPRLGNVHDVAGPEARVVYVDYDPVAVCHFEAVLHGCGNAAAIHADATRPDLILKHPAVTELIDFDRPVALLATYMLHLIGDEHDPVRVLGEYRDVMAPGSHLVLTHPTLDGVPRVDVDAACAVFEELREPVTLRCRNEIGRLFEGFEPLDPGLVMAPEWRPDRLYAGPSGWLLSGVGRRT